MRREEAELTFKLGHIVRRGHHLETLVAITLSQALRIDIGIGGLIASRLGASPTLSLVQELSERDDFPLHRESLNAFIKAARIAIEARNDAMHSAWAAELKTGELKHVIKRGKLVARTVADLDAVSELIESAIQAHNEHTNYVLGAKK